MVSKEFFEFISAHCGNVVAWLLTLWPFIHLLLMIFQFIFELQREYKNLLKQPNYKNISPIWIMAFELASADILPHIVLYSFLTIFYIDAKVGAILFIVSIILFLIFVLDFTIELQVSITPMAVITLIGAVLLIELLFYFLGF